MAGKQPLMALTKEYSGSGQRTMENYVNSQPVTVTLEWRFSFKFSGGVVADASGVKYSCKVAGKIFLS